MQVGLRTRPVPHCDHDIALGALRARRLGGRQLALGDAVGPVTEDAQTALGAEALDGLDHVLAGLARLNPARPSLISVAELAQRLRDRARRLAADGVTMEAAIGLELAQELRLAVHLLVDAIAVMTGTGKLALLRHLGHREPIDRRIELGSSRFTRRRNGGEVHDLARL